MRILSFVTYLTKSLSVVVVEAVVIEKHQLLKFCTSSLCSHDLH